MDRNSSEPVETRNSQVYALKIAQEWFQNEGGRARIPTALSALIDATISALERGDPPPEKDGGSLYEIWRLAQDRGRDAPGTPPRGPEVVKWWRAREGHIQQICRDRGCGWMPELHVRTGGGRQIQTVYLFHLAQLPPDAAADVDGTSSDQGSAPEGRLIYRIDPAKPALWLRILIGSKPFPINSWRGYLLLGSVAVDIVLIGLIWWAMAHSWARAQPVTTGHLFTLTLAVVISFALWRFTRPIRLLPTWRVTLGHEGLMSWSTLHGQLRTMHDGETRFAGRTFSMVRHWGICPICSAEIDLADGGREFPQRLVGRCSDAPMEHVFSFDPVRLTGAPLRPNP